MASVVAAAGVPWVLMHRRGDSRDMYAEAAYDDVVAEVRRELGERVDAALSAGVAADRLVVDPGLGFAKQPEHDLAAAGGPGPDRRPGVPRPDRGLPQALPRHTARDGGRGSPADRPARQRHPRHLGAGGERRRLGCAGARRGGHRRRGARGGRGRRERTRDEDSGAPCASRGIPAGRRTHREVAIRMTSTVDTTAPVTTGLYIGGQERSTSDVLDVVDPARPGWSSGTRPRRRRRTWPTPSRRRRPPSRRGRRCPRTERAAQMAAAIEGIADERDEDARILSLENGKIRPRGVGRRAGLRDPLAARALPRRRGRGDARCCRRLPASRCRPRSPTSRSAW